MAGSLSLLLVLKGRFYLDLIILLLMRDNDTVVLSNLQISLRKMGLRQNLRLYKFQIRITNPPDQ